MDDTITNEIDATETTTPEPRPSASVELRPSKTAANTAVSKEIINISEEKLEKIHDRTSSVETLPKVDATLETTIEGGVKPEEKTRSKPDVRKPEDERKPLIDSLVTETPEGVQEGKDNFVSKSTPDTPTVETRRTRAASATSGLLNTERINRNQSDIFSLKEETTIGSSIFSVNGSPSRKVYRRRELTASNVFPFGQKEEPPSEKVNAPSRNKTKETYGDAVRPSSSIRNPLTGTGLSSNDEYKCKGNKRKEDGNPLLGLGYSPEATPSSHRIPPGGYCHKLW